MFYLKKEDRLVIPRTELTYPGHRLEMHQKAATAPVDHVMADFEDACPYEYKGEASRKVMVEALHTVDFGDKIVTVRPNNVQSSFFLGDLEAVLRGAVDRFHGIILPKTQSPEEIVFVSRLLDHLERENGWKTRLAIESLIEVPIAVVRAYEIASASDRMAGLIFGMADFAATLGVRETVRNQNQNFHYVKQAVVVAAKAAGCHAMDNAYFRLWRKETPLAEVERIQAELREKNEGARDLGMDGSWVIHPQQAEIVNEVFSPPPEEIKRARHAVEFYHAQGGGSIYDPEYDEFHDEATIKLALMQLAKGVQMGSVDPAYLREQARKSAEITGYDILSMMRQVV